MGGDAFADAAPLNIPLFSTTLHTYEFNKIAQRILEEFFAPHAIIHGSLVDVYGVGMLYVGDSNVGKSECVLDLVVSGHRMVADDVVHISNVGRAIIGRPDPLIKHHMEIRGVGILDIRSMFGIHAIRKVKKIETIVELQQWQRDGGYDRTGLNEQEEEVMGVKIPKGRTGARLMIETLKQGKFISILCDQKFREGIPLTFFGMPAQTATAMASLAIKMNVPIIMVKAIQQRDMHYKLSAYPPVPIPVGLPRTEAERQVMIFVNQVYEKWIKENPEQWLWIHRRFDKHLYK